ncbi:Hypothetical_protein [Hexamita inflata]|uniref:Hypothetical_protein n=1 Tax=Hexamita inflata TaxID=28002 RepID=A0AA86UM56_9EUKA|nr:Hypothetical protein HINF_LOCUS51315 [Hexamita inflata]
MKTYRRTRFKIQTPNVLIDIQFSQLQNIEKPNQIFLSSKRKCTYNENNKIELAKVVTIHQEKIKIIKQSECTAAQTSNVQRFLERRQPPHFRAGSNTQYINGFWIYFWKTTRLSSRCSQSLFRRPRFYNPHYGAFTNLHISKTEGQAVFGFSIQTDSVFLQPPLNKQSRCFRLNSPQDASFKVFSSVRLIYARPKWKEPWLEKRQGTPLIQSVLETPRRYRASPGSGREFLNLVCLYVCRSLIQLHAPPKLLEQMAPRQAVACQRCHGAFHHFILNSKTKMVRSAQLARVETPQRTVLAPYLISPDGRSGRFLQDQRKLLRIRGGAAVYFECLQHGTAETAVIERVPSLTAAQTSNVQRFLERRQPPHFRAGSNTQYINGFWIYFWKTTRLSSRCSQSLFRRPRFYNPHYGAFTNLHISKNRGIGRFRFQYINRLCVLVATLEQIKPLFQTEFAIGRKLQSFQFRSINLRAAQMERAVARKAARNATDPVCFGNAAKVQSEPWERERVLKSSLSIRVPQFDLAACTAKTTRINGASLGCSLSTMSWCISSFHPQLQNQDGSLGLISVLAFQ